jgi:CBS domain containing-hemolysin-like protein
MLLFIIALFFLLLSLSGVVARKTYYYVSAKELKRQAAAGDLVSTQLYQAVSYGDSLRVLLWLYISLTAAIGVVLLARLAPAWLGCIAVVVLLWIFYSWLPASRVTSLGMHVTRMLNPIFLRLLHLLHPSLSRSAKQVIRRYNAEAHTGLYEKADLLELLSAQQAQPGSRFTAEELAIAAQALQFDTYKVRDILTPRVAIRTVSANDTVGPILIDEIHRLEHPFVLVADKDEHDIIGILTAQSLGIDSTGKVADHVQQTVYFLHENDSLADALQAYHHTNSSLYVVVNTHQEYVGIITLSDVLARLLGPKPAGFNDYEDRRAVADRHQKIAKPEILSTEPLAVEAEAAEHIVTFDDDESSDQT